MGPDHKVIDGSFRTILRIAFPLMISELSNNLLLLTDRMILAYHSINSMNAAAICGNLCSIFVMFWLAIAGVAEVYVGQGNGRKEYNRLAIPSWQMIYFSLLGFLVFLPVAYFTEYINLLPDFCKAEGIEYQRTITCGCALPALKIAFASFFIGQGKTKIITYSVLFGSILNVFLDILLIFGYKDLIPSLGCRGAALATIISEIVQIVILALIFFNKNNRNHYKTWENRKFNKEVFFGCIKIGYPMSIGRVIDLAAWYLIYAALSHVSRDLATIDGITVSIYILFAFITDSLSKSAATISSNLIGQDKLGEIQKAFKRFVAMTLGLCLIMTIPLIFKPEIIFFFLDRLHEDISGLYPEMTLIFKLILISVGLEAIGCMIWGILLSGGDTKYPMVVNLSFLWAIVVVPIIAMFYMNNLHSVSIVYQLTLVWDFVVLCFFYRRYKSLKWFNLIKISRG